MARKAIGTYYGTLIGAGVDTLKSAKKTPFLYLTFRITHFFDGTGWATVGEPFDRDVKFFLSDTAWPYVEKDLAKCGFNGDFENPKFKDEFYNGTELLCSNATADTDGKTYENWELPGIAHNAPKERVLPPKEVLHRMNARWKTNNSARQVPQTNRPSPPPIASSRPANVPEPKADDLPF